MNFINKCKALKSQYPKTNLETHKLQHCMWISSYILTSKTFPVEWDSLFIYINMYVYVCIYVCVWMYVCMCVCVYIYIYVYVCMYMYICVYMYVYICVCVYMYICMYDINWIELVWPDSIRYAQIFKLHNNECI